MKCSNCGADLAEGTKFCGACGTAVAAEAVVEEPIVAEAPAETAETPETVETTEPKKEKGPNKVMLALAAFGAKVKTVAQPVVDKCKPFVEKNKLWIAGGACLAILLITVLIVIGACNSGNGFIAVEHAIDAGVSEDGEVLVRFDNKKMIKTGIEAKSVKDRQYSIDGNVMAFRTNDNQLVVVKGKKTTVVAENVIEYILSVDGTGIGFVTDEEDGAALHLMKVGKKKAKTVMEQAPTTFDLSPDGKSMVYTKLDEDSGEVELMFFSGSKSKKITSSNVDLVGLSNKGKQIYVVGENDEGDKILYCYNTRGNKKKVGSCVTTGFIFNNDHTQILFYDGNLSWSDGIEAKTYVSVKGKEAKRISSSFAIPLIPNSSTGHDNDNAATFPSDDLFNKVYACQKDSQTNLWLLKKNENRSKRLASNVSEAVLDESGKYVYYGTKGNNLKMLKISHGERAADKAKIIAEDVENFVVTSDRSKVYFVSDDALYSVNGKTGKGKKTIAAENVGYSLALNQKDVCYYYVDEDVYACSNGRRGKVVVQEAEDMEATANGIVYIETEDSIYATKTAKKPAKIYTEG